MRRALLLVALLASVGAAASAGATGPRSGIAGRTVEGPTCPVERVPPDPQCAPRPLEASVRITRVGGHMRPRVVRSGANGDFRARLAPGTYEVQGLRKDHSFYPRPPAPQRVRVYRGRFTRVTLTYDTGIR